MKTKIQEAIALVKQTNDLLNDVAGILSAVEKPKVEILRPNESNKHFTNKCEHDVTIKTEIENMEELYATGNYDWYYKSIGYGWIKYPNQNVGKDYNENTYRLIHKKHSHIARAVIKNPYVEIIAKLKESVEWEDLYNPNFFEGYNEELGYALTKPDGTLDNKRIKVIPETKDEIEAIIRSHGYEVFKSNIDMEDGFYWLVYSDIGALFTYATNKYLSFNKLTEIYLHKGQLVDELPSEECFFKIRHNKGELALRGFNFCPYCGTKLKA